MPDRILSTVVFNSSTNSYANLAPADSPLLINDTGDLIFNTNNLALYNLNSNNKIIRPTGPFSNYFGTNLDNTLIGGNNSKIIGGSQSIINSSDSIISGDYFTTFGFPNESCRYTYFSSITNSTVSRILEAGGFSSIYSSQYSCITGGQVSMILNGYGTCIEDGAFSTIISSISSRILARSCTINTTGKVIRVSNGGDGPSAHLLGGCVNRINQTNRDLSTFNSIFGGTGWANGGTSIGDAINCDLVIIGGAQASLANTQNSNIYNSFCSQICGVPNAANVTKSDSTRIVEWSFNKGNSILASQCSCIFNQVNNSLILGGCKNEIISSDYPIYFSGTDSANRNDRIISHSAILVGRENKIKMGASCSVIVGGFQNQICSGFLGSAILGGNNNKLGCSDLSGCFSTIVNGQSNSIRGGCFQNISAGFSNLIGSGGCNTILNGYGNTMFQSLGTGNLIGNGESNSINSNPTNIGSCYNTIVNGKSNCNYSNLHSTIINGCNNKITSATSSYVLIGGGSDHCVVGNASYSYILGGCKGYIQNGHSGSAILADGQDRSHPSFNSHNLTLDFINGVYFAQTGIFGQTNFSTTPQVGGTTVALSNNVVDLQNNQNVGGIKNFSSRPTANGTGVLLIGEAGGGGFVAPPVTSNSPGTSGQVATDSNYFYSYDGSKWKRTALAEW